MECSESFFLAVGWVLAAPGCGAALPSQGADPVLSPLSKLLFADQPGRSKNRHQHPEGNQDQTELEWWWIKRFGSRHWPTDSCHSQSENYQQDANNKHHPVFIHGNRSS